MSGYLQVLSKSSLSTCRELSAVLGAIHSLHAGHLLSTYALLDIGIGHQKDGLCVPRAQSPGKEIADEQITVQQSEQSCTRGECPGRSKRE